MRLGPLNPEFSHNRAYREYYRVSAAGAAERANLTITGQCRDHRCGAGLSAYVDLGEGDILVSTEHSSHPGPAWVKLLVIRDGQAVALTPESPESLRALRALLDAGIMPTSVDEVATRLLGLDADVSAPAGW